MAVEKCDVTNAVAVLSKLQWPVMLSEYDDNTVLVKALELERQEAITDIIEFLKKRTESDLGPHIDAWVLASGDPSLKVSQAEI